MARSGQHRRWTRWKCLGIWSEEYKGIGLYGDVLQSLKENA